MTDPLSPPPATPWVEYVAPDALFWCGGCGCVVEQNHEPAAHHKSLTRFVPAALAEPLRPREQHEDTAIVNAITGIVRDADRTFERVGGSSRHWVRDCFLPMLNARGFVIVDALRSALLSTQKAEPQPQDGK